MRTTGKAMAVKALMVGAATMSIALAGCGSADNTGSGASSGPSTSGPTSTSASSDNGSGSAASCLIGNWRTTGLAGTFNSNGINGSLTGGGGATVNIGTDGKTTVNFDNMQPVDFNFT